MADNKPCPQCRSMGRDKTGDHLFLLKSGEAWHCTRCKYTVPVDGAHSTEETKISQLTIEDVKNLQTTDYRDIDTTILASAGVVMGMSTSNRNEVSDVFYPMYNTDNELVAYKQRHLPKQFFTVGSVKDQQLQFFGQSAIGAGGRLLVVVEGEDDVLAARDILKSLGKSYNVVGLHSAAWAERTARDNISFLESFETVIFACDQDAPGMQAAIAMSGLLTGGKSKIARWTDAKDVCDLMADGRHKDFLSALWTSKVYVPKGIVAAGDYKSQWLERPPRVSLPLPECFADIDAMIDGVGKGELLIATGGTGCVPAYTEFFTGTGWKPISEYSVGDKVLQYNEDGSASLVDPLAYVKIETSDPFNRFKNTSVDMELSDEHRMVFISRKTGKLLSKSAQQVVETTETTERGYRSGGVLSTMSTTGTVDEFDERLLRLKVAVLADGSHHGLKVRINLKKSRKKDRLRKLLQGLDYSEVAKDNGYSVFTFNQSIVDKSFPDSWWSFSRKPLSVIADEAYHWDGSVKTQEFFTKDSRMFDMMQWVFTCTASTRVSSYVYDRGDGPEYTLRVSRNDSKLSCIGHHTNKRMVVTKVDPVDGYKYCFNVPSSMLILRNNNYIFVTGNSGKSQMFDECTGFWLEQGYRVGKLAMEHSVARSIDNTLSVMMGSNLKKYRDDYTPEQLDQAYEHHLGDNRYFLIDHSYDDADDKSILEKTRSLAVTNQCDVIIVDHLNAMLYEDSDDSGTTREDRVVRDLVKLANQCDVAIVLIAHPRKTTSGSKSVEQGAVLVLDDLKGSSGIKQQPDVIIAAARDITAEDPTERRKTEYRVLKNRYHSDTGPAGATLFNTDTARYEAYQGEF